MTNVAALSGFDADAAAWRAAVIAASGAVSGQQMAYVNALVQGLKAGGAWYVRDDYALYAAENSTQALITLKLRLSQTATNSPTFTANRGYKGDATAAYIDTKWNPGSGSPQYTKNSASYGLWCYLAPATVGRYLMGFSDLLFGEIKHDATNISYSVNTNAAGNFDTYAHGGNVTGWHVFERTGSAAEAAYLNDVQKGTGVQTATAGSLDNFNGYVLASTQGSAPRVSTDAGVSAAFWGAPLSAAQRTAEYNAFRSYMTSVGVP